MKNKNTGYLLLTILLGLIILAPQHNIQVYLAQGDHGRDLYAFQSTLEGKTPYRDYFWEYGPLMPYYYSLFFKFLGIHIPSILIGKIILNLSSGVFIYLILSTLITPLMAVLGACWFWVFWPDFWHTYNHAGGVTMILANLYLLFLYLQDQKVKYLYWGLIPLFLLSLIKVNFGWIGLLAFLLCIKIIDQVYKVPLTPSKKKFYLISLIGLPLLTVLIYFFFVKGLPLYYIRQCLPYYKSDHVYNVPLFSALAILFKLTRDSMTQSNITIVFAFLTLFCTAHAAQKLLDPQTEKGLKNKILLTVLILIIFYIANLHELLASGVDYTLNWSRPFDFMLIFVILWFGLRDFSFPIRLLSQAALILILLGNFYLQQVGTNAFRVSGHYLPFDKAKGYYMNPPDWTNTVIRTTNYLKETLKEDETFFALPYETLYYYLTDKKNPTPRQQRFFDHMNITPQQETMIIAALEEKKINYIIVSNRAVSREPGLGVLGGSYCPLIGQYILENFKRAAQFGPLDIEGGWAWNHGIKVLKRKNPL